MENSEGPLRRFFNLGDLLRDRIRRKGHEREIGHTTEALTQLAAFGDEQWSYFGQVRQTIIRHQVDKKLMREASEFARQFKASIDALEDKCDACGLPIWEDSSNDTLRWFSVARQGRTAGPVYVHEDKTRHEPNPLIRKQKETAQSLLRLLGHAASHGWNEYTQKALDSCRIFLTENSIPLAEAKQLEGDSPIGKGFEPSKLWLGTEEVDLWEEYHYELVRPNSTTPKTIILPYSLFKHCTQMRYNETSEGEKTKYRMFLFFAMISWVFITIMTEVLTMSGLHPGAGTTNYFLVPVGISLAWLAILWYVARVITGTTWVHVGYLVSFGRFSDREGPQPMLIVNSQSIDFIQSVADLLNVSPENLHALGETMRSFQEEAFERYRVEIDSYESLTNALMDDAKKRDIADEAEALSGVRQRVVRKAPSWAYLSLVVIVVLSAVIAIMGVSA